MATILVLDDDRLVPNVAKNIPAHCGFRVLAAAHELVMLNMKCREVWTGKRTSLDKQCFGG